MFVFIAGIQPKTRIADKTSQNCPHCDSQQVYLKRIDHYLNIFFIPVFPVKKGAQFLECEQCKWSEQKI